MTPTFAFRLATAHLAAALLTFAALVCALVSWTGSELEWFDTPARIVHYAGLMYLTVTASVELDTALALRRHGSIERRSWPLVVGGHLSVVAMVAAALVRAADSRALHAGLDVLLATLAAAGGLALGLEQTGWHHLALVESNEHACSTIHLNESLGHPLTRNWELFPQDVRDMSYKHLEQLVDMVAGGPPCQPFSLGGKHRAHRDDRDMFPEAVRAV
ncbi:MAG: DNA cytosine methyltransferase, partial [Planctomycetes bacterium]|nr:DNA cytosine methyltransferase [Planctomycetota bacterium]